MSRLVLEDQDLHFTLKGELLPNLRAYCFAFCSLLPGIVLGSTVLMLWYGAAIVFLLQRRSDRLVLVFVIWNFLNRGAYHYGLIGPSESDVLLRSFNSFLLLLLAIAYAFSKHNGQRTLHVYLRFGVALSAIAFLSAVANGVGVVDFIEYYFIYFRWLIFAFLFWNLDLPRAFLRTLVVLVFVIVGVNSMLGMLQAFVLPPQVTPAGYIPYELDVASGLLGVTFSQHLTVLCLSVASFFAFRYLQSGGRSNALFIVLMLIQPFSSESKFAMVMCIGLFSVSALVLFLGGHLRTSVISLVPKIGFLVVLGIIGVEVYGLTTGESLINPVSGYSETITSAEDIRKLMGYVVAFTEVAPGGRFGSSLGVGPTRFLNTVGGETSDYSSLLQIGTEANDLSSLEKQNTEIVATIGELGCAGFAVFVGLMIKMIIDCVKRLRRVGTPDMRAFVLFECQYIITTVILTFYLQGWLVAFYYVPMFIFIAFDVKCLSVEHGVATVEGNPLA